MRYISGALIGFLAFVAWDIYYTSMNPPEPFKLDWCYAQEDGTVRCMRSDGRIEETKLNWDRLKPDYWQCYGKSRVRVED